MQLLSKRSTLWVLILIQVILIGVTLKPLIKYPHNYLLQSKGDGAKNYFT